MKLIIQHHANELRVVRNVKKSYYAPAGVLIVLRLIINLEIVILARLVVTAVEGTISQSSQVDNQDNKTPIQSPTQPKRINLLL